MLNKTRNTITQVAAGVGGLAALVSAGTVIDTVFGAALWAAVSYGVCTLIIKYKN